MKKKAILYGIVTALMLSIIVTAYAASGYTMTYLPGTTDTVTNLSDADTGTGGEAYGVSPQIPQREGYEFIGWTLDYGLLTYKVTYVVNPDPTYGFPAGYTVPTDLTQYAPGEMVDVAAQLTTAVDYAYNENGEKVQGSWEFETWDKDDFPITEDTTITGGWVFTPAPTKEYHYTVQYRLWDGKEIGKVVAKEDSFTIDSLGISVTANAKPIADLKKPYCNKNKYGEYNYRIATPYRIETIRYDGYIITILYEEIPKRR